MLKLDGMQDTLNCSKCKGLIVRDTMTTESFYRINTLRCINCGKVTLCNREADSHEKVRRANKLDELELYRPRGGRPKRNSNSIQY